MNLKDSITDSVELEERSPASTRLYTKVAMLASAVDLLLFFVSVITYQIDEELGLNVLSAVLLPMLILLIAAFYLAVAERLRAKYLGANIAIILCVVMALCVLGCIVYELVKYGKVYVAPFNPPPVFNID